MTRNEEERCNKSPGPDMNQGHAARNQHLNPQASLFVGHSENNEVLSRYTSLGVETVMGNLCMNTKWLRKQSYPFPAPSVVFPHVLTFLPPPLSVVL